VIFALALGDRQVVDASEASAHQTVLVELPVFIAVRAEPVAAIVMPLIGKAYRNPVVGKRPYFFDFPALKPEISIGGSVDPHGFRVGKAKLGPTAAWRREALPI
jgi:hypothetical protein